MTAKPAVLILCTGNSCRSHLAEGLLRSMAGDLFAVHSAGTQPAGYVHPLAVSVMQEIGLDISGHRSQHIDEFKDVPLDYVITVCGHADENCPIFPGPTKVVHHGFDDPPKLAREAATEEEGLNHYRRVRDEIRAYVETLPESLTP